MAITYEQRNKILELFKDKITLKDSETVNQLFRGKTGTVVGYQYQMSDANDMWSPPTFSVIFRDVTPYIVRVDLNLVDSPELERVLHPQPEVRAVDDAPGWGVLIGSAALATGIGAILKRVSKRSKQQTVKEEQKKVIEVPAVIKV